MSRFAFLWNATNPVKVRQMQALQQAASTLGLTLLSVEVRRDVDFDSAYQAVRALRPDALVVAQEPLMAAHAAEIAAVSVEQRLPSMYETRLYADAGGLMSYGVQSVERYYRAASYVDKILRGAKPADLPVEQPTHFDFVINLKTAQALGVTVPSPSCSRPPRSSSSRPAHHSPAVRAASATRHTTADRASTLSALM